MSILKWIGIVFVAGFIGYFGKFLAIKIISRFSKKKESAPAKPNSPTKEELDYKLEKKRLKLEKKRIKKEKK
jgi:hypothetical protein